MPNTPYGSTAISIFGGALNLIQSAIISTPAAQYYSNTGIFEQAGGVISISQSTFAYLGTAIFTQRWQQPYSLNVVNSTFYGNQYSYAGEGLAATFLNSTFANNANGFIPNDTNPTPPAVVLRNNVMADGCLIAGTSIIDGGYNMAPDNSCFFTSATSQSNVSSLGLDPAGLASNGGPTQTVALIAGSPAIDQIPLTACTGLDGVTPLTVDQRNFPRPVGPKCDIGAFEFAPLNARLDVVGTTAAAYFDLTATLTANSLDPNAQPFNLQVGAYTLALPAESFKVLANGSKQGSWTYQSMAGGVSLSIQITEAAANTYQVKVDAGPVNIGTAKPVIVKLYLGNVGGSAAF